MRRKLLGIGLVLIAPVVIAACSSKSTNSGTAVTTTTASGSKATTATTAPAPTTTAPAVRQATGTAVTLGSGTFTGGKDVQAGLYNVTPGAGQSGNFSTTGNNQTYNEILGVTDGEGVPSLRAQISSGDQITISGLSSVTFSPVPTQPLVTAHATVNLTTGTWTVGQDIGSGRYVATTVPGQSGNFVVTGTDSYNEILGGSSADGGVPSVTVSLTNGDVIQVSGMSQATMTAQ